MSWLKLHDKNRKAEPSIYSGPVPGIREGERREEREEQEWKKQKEDDEFETILRFLKAAWVTRCPASENRNEISWVWGLMPLSQHQELEDWGPATQFRTQEWMNA